MAIIGTLVMTLLPDPHSRAPHCAVAARIVSTSIEPYNFFLYNLASRLLFAKLYPPRADPLVGLLEAPVAQAVGFVARPVGAAIFGHYGDRVGRKPALIATLLLTGATFLLAYGIGMLDLSRDLLLVALLAAVFVSFVTIPLAGHLSDRNGRTRIYIAGALMAVVADEPALLVATALLARHHSGHAIYILAFGLISAGAAMLTDHTNKDVSQEHDARTT